MKELNLREFLLHTPTLHNSHLDCNNEQALHVLDDYNIFQQPVVDELDQISTYMFDFVYHHHNFLNTKFYFYHHKDSATKRYHHVNNKDINENCIHITYRTPFTICPQNFITMLRTCFINFRIMSRWTM
jgi:hypothetical protein